MSGIKISPAEHRGLIATPELPESSLFLSLFPRQNTGASLRLVPNHVLDFRFRHFPGRTPGPHCDLAAHINTRSAFDISPAEHRGLIATESGKSLGGVNSNFPGRTPGPHCDCASTSRDSSGVEISPAEHRGLIATSCSLFP